MLSNYSLRHQKAFWGAMHCVIFSHSSFSQIHLLFESMSSTWGKADSLMVSENLLVAQSVSGLAGIA